MLGRPDQDQPDDIGFTSRHAELAARAFGGLHMSLNQLSAARWLSLSPGMGTSTHEFAATVE
jgi:hypothetical protein